MSEKFKNWLKKEPGYWVGLISGIITIYNEFNAVPEWFRIVSCTVVVIFFVLTMYRLVRYFVDSDLSHRELEERLKTETDKIIARNNSVLQECSDNIHKYCHNLRNHIGEIEHMPSNPSLFLSQICTNICNDVERTISTLWKEQKVSVCIKQLVEGTCLNSDFRTWQVITIARSGGSDINRNRNNSIPVSIGENSDFEVIISPDYQDSIFSCKDLTAVDDEFFKKYQAVYKNSTKGYIELYKSTIVVPIRIEKSKANDSVANNAVSNYHLVGFLCIDTKEAFTQSDASFNAAINCLKAFSDILYKFFEAILIIRNKSKIESED